MATPGIELINGLRTTAEKLDKGSVYHWGHMGACNCGSLAQELLSVSKSEIHRWALDSREGDWSEQTDEYCANSNLPMDLMIRKLLDRGLTISDLANLEKLSDPEILNQIPVEYRELNYHHKKDVIIYLKAWAELLTDKLVENFNIDSLISGERINYKETEEPVLVFPS